MGYIKGNFRQYIFKSDKGYVVGLFKVKDASEDLIDYKNKTVTFTGYFTDLNENNLYIFNGNIINHEKYGEQFSVLNYEITLPNDKDNIIEFLSSNLFPGIGEKKAQKIVDVLGVNCLDIIINTPDNLFLVPTITKKQRDIIYDNLLNYQGNYKIIVELNKCGFSTKDSLVIYNTYKEKTLSRIKDNVYRLVDDIYDMSFSKIDQLRNNFNISDIDERRIKACIKYVMDNLSYSSGNTYFSLNDIVLYTKKVLFIYDNDKILSCLNKLIEDKDIIVIDNKYFLKKMYIAEKYVADRVFRLANNYEKNIISEKSIEELEKYYSINFDHDQLKAIMTSLENKFLVITGGPGTGKTTIIKAITKLYQDINGYSNKELLNNMALLAPTGRASKRISEQTGLPSSTIHRFLKWNKEDNTFLINEENLSDVDFVIIDESSMIDIYLMYNLFLGLKLTTKIILIGDYDQLPSVGPGQVLKDIIDSDCVDVIRLTKLYRVDKDSSNISVFAYNINHNIIDFDIFNNSDDLLFVDSSNEEIKDKLNQYIVSYKDYDFNKFQVLAPIYKGENGIDDLNYFMQEIINPPSNTKNQIVYNGIVFRQNDKVLQLTNMVDDNIFNGDIGKILNVKGANHKEIVIDFDSNIVRFTPANFINIKLGYTISIHKSQGSEFDVVIIPILNKYNNMLYKKLIYTAVTRAKKKLILIGEREALQKAILNDRENNRQTNLKNFISLCINTK